MISMHWQLSLRALLAASILLIPATALGDATGVGKLVCDPDDPQSCVQPVKAKAPAPFTGLLLSKRRAAIVTAKAEKCDEHVALARSEAQELGARALRLEQDQRASDARTSEDKIKASDDALETYKARFAPKASDHPLLWLSIGVALTALAIGTSIAALEARNPTAAAIP